MDNKGQTGGLSILMGVIATVFILGILVMLFVLVNSGVQDTLSDDNTATIVNQTTTGLSNTTYTDLSTRHGCIITSIDKWHNGSNSNATFTRNSANYSVESRGCGVKAVGTLIYRDGSTANISYTMTYPDESAYDSVNESKNAIGSVSDWTGIIILVGVIVGILGLVALVIIVLRGAGMLGGGSDGGNVGGSSGGSSGGLFGGGSSGGDMLD